MISEITLSVPLVREGLQRQQVDFQYPLDVLVKEVKRVQKRLPRSYDTMARLMALSRPIVEVVMLEAGCYQEELERQGKGRPQVSRVSLMTLLLFQQVKGLAHDRQMQRVLAQQPQWLHALGLKKAPDHDTIGKFRNSLPPHTWDAFFHKLTASLFAFGLMTGDSEMIVDSAPVEANQNFARSNAAPKLDEARLEAFLDALDLTPALRLIAAPSDRGRPAKYSNDVLLKFLLFEKVCGFLSRSQAVNYLPKHVKVARMLGFDPADLPTLANITSFLDRIPPVSWIIRPLVGQMTEFFDAQSEYDEEDPLALFFWGPSYRRLAAGP